MMKNNISVTKYQNTAFVWLRDFLPSPSIYSAPELQALIFQTQSESIALFKVLLSVFNNRVQKLFYDGHVGNISPKTQRTFGYFFAETNGYER